jgi:hypothetical protein
MTTKSYLSRLKSIEVVAATVLSLAAVGALAWGVARPHLDERYLQVETAQQSITRQYEDQSKIITRVFAEIDVKAKRSRRDDLHLQLDLNLLEQKFLGNLPVSERTPRDDVRLRFLRDQQRRINDELKVIEAP